MNRIRAFCVLALGFMAILAMAPPLDSAQDSSAKKEIEAFM